MDTQQQRMAVTAYNLIRTVEKADQPKYGTMAHKLPMLIRRSGLAQALAFVNARGEKGQLDLLDHLAQTIELADVTTRENLVQRSREADLATYLLLTRRVLAALVWYKRFTESVLKIPAQDDDARDTQPAEETT